MGGFLDNSSWEYCKGGSSGIFCCVGIGVGFYDSFRLGLLGISLLSEVTMKTWYTLGGGRGVSLV